MSKPRTCPYCRTVLGIMDGFVFDASLNLLCGNCGKVVFLTTELAAANFLVQKGVPSKLIEVEVDFKIEKDGA